MRAAQCLVDGIIECNETKTCEKCRQDEAKWNESWFQWKESRSNDDVSRELVGAGSVRP